MVHTVNQKEFPRITAVYFSEKASKVKGPGKLLVALEKSKYIADALNNGLSFSDLKELGFKFETV